MFSPWPGELPHAMGAKKKKKKVVMYIYIPAGQDEARSGCPVSVLSRIWYKSHFPEANSTSFAVFALVI